MAGIEYAGQAMAVHASLTSKVALAGGVLAALRDVRYEPGDMSTWTGELVVRARLLARSANAARYEFSLSHQERIVMSGTALVAFERKREEEPL